MQIKTVDQLTLFLAGSLGMDSAGTARAIENYIQQIETLDGRPIDRNNLDQDDVQFITCALQAAQRAGDLGSKYLHLLEENRAEITQQEDRLADLRTERDDIIVDAIKDGARIKDIVECSGVSRTWVQKLKRNIK